MLVNILEAVYTTLIIFDDYTFSRSVMIFYSLKLQSVQSIQVESHILRTAYIINFKMRRSHPFQSFSYLNANVTTDNKFVSH